MSTPNLLEESLSSADSLDGDDFSLVILTFANAFIQPTELQVKYLAILLGLSLDGLLGHLAQIVDVDFSGNAAKPVNPPDQVDPEDPLGDFLLAYFVFNDSPSSEEMQAMSLLTGMSFNDLADRMNTRLGEITG